MARKLTTVRLACDLCGATRQGRIGDSVATLRTALIGVGWSCGAGESGDVDLCQACIVEAPAPPAALAVVR